MPEFSITQSCRFYDWRLMWAKLTSALIEKPRFLLKFHERVIIALDAHWTFKKKQISTKLKVWKKKKRKGKTVCFESNVICVYPTWNKITDGEFCLGHAIYTSKMSHTTGDILFKYERHLEIHSGRTPPPLDSREKRRASIWKKPLFFPAQKAKLTAHLQHVCMCLYVYVEG